MILATADFKKAISTGQFEPGYLLAGNEIHLRDRFRALLVKTFVDGKAEDVAEHDLGEIRVADALDDAASLGLFAGRRLLWLRNAEALLPRRRSAASDDDDSPAEPQTAGKHSSEAIAWYFKNPLRSSVVVFEATSLDLGDRDDLRKVERLEKLLPVPSVRLERPPAAQAARYLTEEARTRGFTLEPDAARNLIDSCAGELARAATELEKLMLYASGRGRVTADDIAALVTPESSFTIWEISDAIGERDSSRALRLVQEMLRQDVPPLLMTALIAGQVRKLLKVKEGSNEWVHPKVRDQARKFSVPELTHAIEKLFEADIALRSSPPEERVVLEQLILELSKKEKPRRQGQ